MIIGPKKLLQLVKEKKLVENLSKRELENPEGAGFDLRLGQIHKIAGGKAFLGINERETPKIKTVAVYNPHNLQRFTIQPEHYYLISTIEKVNLPSEITANIKPRTTTFRSGLIIRTGNVAPGYRGKLTFGLQNAGPLPAALELGCRIVHAQFYWVDGGGSLYRGQWRNGRITTTGREQQI